MKVQDLSLYHLDNLYVDVCHVLHFRGLYSKTNKAPPGDTGRKILALPVRLSGLGIVNPTKLSTSKLLASIKTSALLRDLILNQSHEYSIDSQSTNQRQEGYPQAKSWQCKDICNHTENNLKLSSTCNGLSTRERCFIPSSGGILLHPSQKCLQRRHCSLVWLATIAHPHHMCLWHKLLCGVCTIMCKGWFPHSMTQWSQKPCSESDVSSLSQCVRRTNLIANHWRGTANHWRGSLRHLGNNRGWCQTRRHRNWVLGKALKCAFFDMGVFNPHAP